MGERRSRELGGATRATRENLPKNTATPPGTVAYRNRLTAGGDTRSMAAFRVDPHVKVLNEGVVERAKARGLDAVVYAPHFTRLPRVVARAERFSDDELLVVPAREVFTGNWRNRKHVLAVGLTDPVPDFITLEAAMAAFDRQDAAVLVPHPEFATVSLEAHDIRAHGDRIHGTEVYNPKHFGTHNERARRSWASRLTVANSGCGARTAAPWRSNSAIAPSSVMKSGTGSASPTARTCLRFRQSPVNTSRAGTTSRSSSENRSARTRMFGNRVKCGAYTTASRPRAFARSTTPSSSTFTCASTRNSSMGRLPGGAR